MVKIEKHKERIIETISNMPYDKEAAMDWNRQYRFVIRDGHFSEIKVSEIELMEEGINKSPSVPDILLFATNSPNEFDELIQSLRQAIKETRIVAK